MVLAEVQGQALFPGGGKILWLTIRIGPVITSVLAGWLAEQRVSDPDGD